MYHPPTTGKFPRFESISMDIREGKAMTAKSKSSFTVLSSKKPGSQLLKFQLHNPSPLPTPARPDVSRKLASRERISSSNASGLALSLIDFHCRLSWACRMTEKKSDGTLPMNSRTGSFGQVRRHGVADVVHLAHLHIALDDPRRWLLCIFA